MEAMMVALTYRGSPASASQASILRLLTRYGAILLFLLCAHTAVAADNQEIWTGLFGYQQKMANLGNAEAQYKLAEMYEQGLGVKADREQARHWYQAAAAQGYQPAQQRLANLDATPSTTGGQAAPATPAVSTTAPPVAAPAAAATPPAATAPPTAKDTQELDRLERERQRLQQELAQSREALKKAQEQQALQAQRKEEELRKAEAEKAEALRRLAAQQRLEEERKRMLAAPSAFDN